MNINNLESYMLPCMNKKILGFDCLGCGLQRSILLLLQGEFLEAFKMYPAIYSLIICILYIFLNLKFNFNNSHIIIRFLLAINAILIGGNFILKIL